VAVGGVDVETDDPAGEAGVEGREAAWAPGTGTPASSGSSGRTRRGIRPGAGTGKGGHLALGVEIKGSVAGCEEVAVAGAPAGRGRGYIIAGPT
jgi:hypothetical protein